MIFFSAVKYGALLVGWLAAVGTVGALFFDTGSPAEPKWVGVLEGVLCVPRWYVAVIEGN